jgi:type II secretory pathway pseudopilin PulG
MIEDRSPRDGVSSVGFTLLEVMIILGIMAILMTIAFPSLQRMYVNGNLRSAARDLIGDFNNQKQRAMSGDPAVGGARVHRLVLNIGGNSYILQRCTTTDNICGTWEDMQVKSLKDYGNDISFDPANTNKLAFDFQTRGTVSDGSIGLINNRGSMATVTTNISGRTFAEFIMQ